MRAVKVPQHLELNDVVAWGLGTGDLACVVGGVALGWWLYLVLPDPVGLRVGAAAPPAVAGFALGIGRFGERHLREWLWLSAAYLLRVRVLVTGDPQ